MLTSFIGQVVAADLDGNYLVFGVLEDVTEHALVFLEADLHDHSEANATKEVYAMETKRYGVRANRRRVVVPRSRLIALSLLSDIAD